MDSSIRLSVLTPSYNRAMTLPRLYESLLEKRQGLEWVLVDDGSTDGTEAWVRGLLTTGEVRITAVRQPNAGRGEALNRAVTLMSGRYAILMDSDDLFVRGGLSQIWRQLDWLDAHPGVAGVVGNCASAEGVVVGAPFPVGDQIATFQHAYDTLRVRGDKKEVIRAEVLRSAFPFPTFAGERRVATALIWRRIGRKASCRFVNESWVIKEYRADGLTRQSLRMRAESPRSSCSYYGELLDLDGDAPIRVKARAAVNYCRYRTHATWRGVAVPPTRTGWVRFARPLGWLLAWADRLRAGAVRP